MNAEKGPIVLISTVVIPLVATPVAVIRVISWTPMDTHVMVSVEVLCECNDIDIYTLRVLFGFC